MKTRIAGAALLSLTVATLFIILQAQAAAHPQHGSSPSSDWQLGYQTSINVPKGTKLRVDARFDNSVGNRFNPNPNRTVYYGEMTCEEMMFAFFGVVVDTDSPADRRKIIQTRVATANGA